MERRSNTASGFYGRMVFKVVIHSFETIYVFFEKDKQNGRDKELSHHKPLF